MSKRPQAFNDGARSSLAQGGRHRTEDAPRAGARPYQVRAYCRSVVGRKSSTVAPARRPSGAPGIEFPHRYRNGATPREPRRIAICAISRTIQRAPSCECSRHEQPPALGARTRPVKRPPLRRGRGGGRREIAHEVGTKPRLTKTSRNLCNFERGQQIEALTGLPRCWSHQAVHRRPLPQCQGMPGHADPANISSLLRPRNRPIAAGGEIGARNSPIGGAPALWRSALPFQARRSILPVPTD